MNDVQTEVTDEPQVVQDEAAEIVDEPVVQEEPGPQADPAPNWSEEDEEEARLFGWKSPDEWKGEMPKGYIDNPEDYLGRVRKSRIFTAMEQRQQALTEGLERTSKMALDRQKEQHKAEIERARRERDEAFKNGDDAAYAEANDTERRLLDNPPGEVEQQAGPDPVVEAYRLTENGKWMSNPVLFQAAQQMVQGNKDVLGRPASEQIRYAEGELRRMYPSYFPVPVAPPPKARQVVDGGGLGVGTGAGARDAFSKLPPEAKSDFKRLVADDIFQDTPADRKEYADEFNKQ